MADASQKQVLASIKHLLISGAYSDLTITCGSDTYKVHKAIVCERADFFARALKFGGQESEKNAIDLPDDGPDIIKLLVQYLYEGEYEPWLPDTKISEPIPMTPTKSARKGDAKIPGYSYKFPHSCSSRGVYCNTPNICRHHVCGHYCSYTCSGFNCNECSHLSSEAPSVSGTSDQLLLHAKMYEIADKYDVVGLKDLVIEKFKRSCQNFWNEATFAAAAHHAFMTTPEQDKGLRNIVADTIAAHPKQLVSKPGIKSLLTEFGGLAYDLYKRRVDADKN